MRRLLAALVALAALLAVADRVAVHYVDRSVADRMREDGGLDSTPVVDIRGFPFLSQAVRGRYRQVDVHVRDLRRDGFTVSRLDVTVRGAELPLSQVASARSVPVAGLRATALVTYADLARAAGLAGLGLAAADGGLAVTGTVAGVRATVTSTLALRGGRLVVTARSVGGVGARGLLDFSVRVPALPYGLHLDGAAARPDGVHLAASAGRTVLTPQ